MAYQCLNGAVNDSASARALRTVADTWLSPVNYAAGGGIRQSGMGFSLSDLLPSVAAAAGGGSVTDIANKYLTDKATADAQKAATKQAQAQAAAAKAAAAASIAASQSEGSRTQRVLIIGGIVAAVGIGAIMLLRRRRKNPPRRRRRR